MDLAAKVLVQCSFSPSGYGFRSLTGLELGGLWDLPILVLDALPGPGGEAVLQGFFQLAPTKILFAGADFLLTASFQGGLGGLQPILVGPRPLSDSALGLTRRPLAHDRLPFAPEEVVKGDSQKADDAVVPDHLWLHAFVGGYGDPSCLAQHRSALGLGSGGVGSLMECGGPPSGWQTAMPGFQAFGLRFWRRRAASGPGLSQLAHL